MSNTVLTEVRGPVFIVTINRPAVRNCVDGVTTVALYEAFKQFEANDALKVAILTGADGHFCAGADLKALAVGDPEKMRHVQENNEGPMGPTRMQLTKPVIAAVSGYCVAGGIELAVWCDMRVADETAIFGVFCRRFGVPLIDGGTVRLPRIIGMGNAMDLILTGRSVDANEAKAMHLVNRVVPAGHALIEAEKIANQIAAFPQACMRGDRKSAYEQWGMDEHSAILNEFEHGMRTMKSGETLAGASRFTEGMGRHGQFDADK
ncbi:MAG: crotonase/enoyl-CoA hydratase family protein [Paraperlucidibaca sp.]